MKKEYKTPLTEIVFLSIGKLLQDAGAGTRDSIGDSPFEDANQSTFEVEETTDDLGGKNSLWED